MYQDRCLPSLMWYTIFNILKSHGLKNLPKFCTLLDYLQFYLPYSSQSSNLLNQARLKVLKARDEHVGNVLTDSKRQLANITRDQGKYGKLLEGLIAQGVCQLLESNIQVRCRQADQKLVESVIASAVASVKDKIKMETNVTLDTTSFLPPDW